jgi:hypothetical protein
MPKQNDKRSVDSLPDGYISLAQASELCSYSQEYLSLRARQGRLEAVKFGRNWFIKVDGLSRYIEKNSISETGNKKGELKVEKVVKEAITGNLVTGYSLADWQKVLVNKIIMTTRGIAQAIAGSFFVLKKNVFRPVLWQKGLASLLVVAMTLSSIYFSPAAWAAYREDLSAILDFSREQVGAAAGVLAGWQKTVSDFAARYPLVSPSSSVAAAADRLQTSLQNLSQSVTEQNEVSLTRVESVGEQLLHDRLPLEVSKLKLKLNSVKDNFFVDNWSG